MFVTDPIADMLVRIRNANQRKYKSVVIPYSKIKDTISRIFVEEGYIAGYDIDGKGVGKKIVMALKYKRGQAAISGLKRISKPGLRIYKTANTIPYVLSGFGTALISTSKGMMTDKKAREQKIGGEIIAYI